MVERVVLDRIKREDLGINQPDIFVVRRYTGDSIAREYFYEYKSLRDHYVLFLRNRFEDCNPKVNSIGGIIDVAHTPIEAERKLLTKALGFANVLSDEIEVPLENLLE